MDDLYIYIYLFIYVFMLYYIYAYYMHDIHTSSTMNVKILTCV